MGRFLLDSLCSSAVLKRHGGLQGQCPQPVLASVDQAQGFGERPLGKTLLYNCCATVNTRLTTTRNSYSDLAPRQGFRTLNLLRLTDRCGPFRNRVAYSLRAAEYHQLARFVA